MITQEQATKIKSMNSYDLLDWYNNYYLKVIKDLVPPAEVTDVFDALRHEIMTRMGVERS